MLSVLVLAFPIMNQEGKSLGLQVNWLQTKVQATDVTFSLTLGIPFGYGQR